ncbi:xanthine dehydrogenase family protein molybdopterin-binding subunit [Massilia sp. PAMC28688]|uniref:xanthine dehydrogenase family protein molybdopterin-binding subunit n=1 Tax=Massilia sp. PAMC28688 TaxID=2861283 RepID=UPI001C624F38|nr:xanthine dehydrogenase family protein molybdopterin-binding subunit [Massilia sp. PAMC28688]QYF94537.1 xanthine dehydrogenase family protein molybdopterin-binding subunit [Massilia sp. PAMC28688]
MKALLNMKLRRRSVIKGMAAGAAAAAVATPAAAQAAPARLATGPGAALGERIPRQEGEQKAKGVARYAVERSLDRMVHAVVVQSTIASGRIKRIDSTAARAAPGVIAVYSPFNRLPIAQATVAGKGGAAFEAFTPLQDKRVRFNGQHIALVVAETLEQATHAARLVKVSYARASAVLHMDDRRARAKPVPHLTVSWGDAAAALQGSPVRAGGTYTTPREYNMPMELHACIAAWTGDELTVWEPSQWVGGARQVIAQWMGVDPARVRVVSPYVGGAFGSKASPHPHVAMACAAARVLRRPVKLSLTRQQTFTGFGGRPATRQTLTLGADRDGKLRAIVHQGWNETAIDDMYVEACNATTTITYATPNLASRHSVVPVNTVNPGPMRAPGEAPSSFALETAMDELAYALDLDPIELRLRNYAERDPHHNIAWSSRNLRQAYDAGARAFGWSARNRQPRSMKQGRELIGWGMATGSYPVRRTPGEAKIVLHASGLVEVHSRGADLGTGTYTILAQTVADVLGVPLDHVLVSLGDTTLPRAPVAGGSQLANLLTAAVHKTAVAAREALLDIAATDPRSPLFGARVADLAWTRGSVHLARRPGRGTTLAQLLTATARERVEVARDTFAADATEKERDAADRGFSQMRAPTEGGVSAHSWSAIFVEVRVDEDFGTIRVSRMVGAFDCGRLYNPTLAESQWIGGMVMGVGQALLEAGAPDKRDGRITNANLADYLVPVNADIPAITTMSVGVPDLQASPMGGKAVGEVGIVGVAAAIGNAVFHATGKRIRDLPITLDKI